MKFVYFWNKVSSPKAVLDAIHSAADDVAQESL